MKLLNSANDHCGWVLFNNTDQHIFVLVHYSGWLATVASPYPSVLMGMCKK